MDPGLAQQREAEDGALHLLADVVDRLGAAVGDACSGPDGDLLATAEEGAGEVPSFVKWKGASTKAAVVVMTSNPCR